MQDKTNKQVYSDASILCPGHTRTVVGLDFSRPTPDGLFFVSACLDATPMMRDSTTGNWIGSFRGSEGAVWSVSINKSATLVAAGSADFSAKLWNAVDGELIHTFSEKHVVKAVSINDDSTLLAVGGKSKEVNVYSMKSFERVLNFNFEEEVSFLKFCCIPTMCNLLLCVGQSGKLTLLNMNTIDAPEEKCVQLTDIILDVSLCKDIIAIASCNGVRFLSWDLRIVNKKDYPYHIRTCAVNESKSRYLISEVNTIYEVNYNTHKIIASYHGHHGAVFCLRYNPQNDSFISGSDDSSIRLWRDDSKI